MPDLLVRKWSFFFDLMDHDKNGVWNLKDFVLFGEKIYTVYAVNYYDFDPNDFVYKARKVFNHLKKDLAVKGQEITKEEWLHFLQKQANQPGRRYFKLLVYIISRELFDVCDQNRDDYLSAYELSQLYRTLGLSEETASEALPLLDLNMDGKISKSEFYQGITDFFENAEKEETLFGKVRDLDAAQIVKP
jgi:Ca2+-binding EF-hand superfamily protein